MGIPGHRVVGGPAQFAVWVRTAEGGLVLSVRTAEGCLVLSLMLSQTTWSATVTTLRHTDVAPLARSHAGIGRIVLPN